MRGKRRKHPPTWSYTAGEKGHTVTVYERWPGGPLQARTFDETLRNGTGGYRCVSLRHRDHDKAESYAHEQVAKLKEGQPLDHIPGTLARLFAKYDAHRTPHKSEGEQSEDRRRVKMWNRVLGAGKDPHLVTRGEWEQFIRDRKSGAINQLGKPVKQPEDRRPVRDGTVRSDCLWLRQVFGWATTWREGNEPYLMRENPVRGFDVPDEQNVRRPVASTDRYEKIMAVARHVHPFLPELLSIVHGTGRRVSAVLKLRYENLELVKSKKRPHGAIAWPGETDKMGKAWSAPIGADVRATLERMLRERPGIGAAYLFPVKPETPVPYDTARRWLIEAEQLAELPKQEGSLWHAYRRAWATSRKHLPIGDVAQAGGWESTETLQRCYTQPDDETILAVVLGGAELREVEA